MINDLDEVQYAYLLAPTFQFVNSAGKPITGGWMEVYIHGTRTKYYCCSDWDGTLHPFKIPLDSLGSNIVLASPAFAYDVYVYNRFGSLIMSRYNVIPTTGGASGVVPVDITIESQDETVDVTVSGTTYNISISGTIDKLDTVSADVEELKDIIATGLVQSDWEESDTEAQSYIKNKPDLSIYATTDDLETASGNLVDLIEEVSANTPEQVQSDWTEDDTTSPAYIKNKPEESTLIAGDNIGIFASGSDYVISASGVDTSEFATHTEVNNVSGSIITVVNNVSSTLDNKIDAVSSSIPDVSSFATHTEVNTVSSILESEIQAISGSIPEPFDGYTSPSGTSYIDNTNFTIEQSNSAIDITSINDWNPTGQMEVNSSPDFIAGFTARSNEIKFTANEHTSAIIRIYKEYNGTEYVEGELDNSDTLVMNLPDDYLNREVWFYYDGWIPANITIWHRVGQPITTKVVRELAWKDDLMAVSASIPDVSEFVTETELTSAIDVITGTIPQAQVQSDWTEDDTTDPAYIKNKPDEVNLVAGDNISIVASGSDLIISASGSEPQPTVPNVEIVSPSGSIVVSATVDPQTNTKTFSIDVATASGVEYGQFYATGVTGTANMAKTKGNISVNNGRIQLHKGQSYHVTIRGTYTQTTLVNELSFFNFIENISFRNIAINVNKTISAGQFWELSYDLYNLANDIDYIIAFSNISNAVLSDIIVEVHSLAGGNGTGGSASGVEYTAGYGIQILNDVISVSGINPQVNADWNAVSGVSQVLNKPNEIEIVAGSGINVTESNNQLIISSTVTGGGGGGSYNAGDHIDITNDTISVTGITELVAGNAINITMDGDSAIISSNGEAQVQSDWNVTDSSSKAYIRNKPSIPAAQIQSDWNQTNTYSKDYIKNKPTIKNYTGASGVVIEDTTITLDEPLGIVAGSGINIVIEGDSAIICVSGVTGGGSGTNYQAGYGINIANDTISVDTTVIPDVSTVSAIVEAATGSIPTPVQVNSDWNATSGVAEILNKPIEANLLPGSGITIAASGSDWVINTTPIELVSALPANPVSGVLYLIPEA